jgi:soluble lytic murein transglycosylase
MMTRTFSVKIILALWCSGTASGASTALGALVHAYRESPTPTRKAAIQAYVAGHPKEAPLANLGMGIAAYEQKNFAGAVALLAPAAAQLPQVADYAGYYLAASRVETNDFAPVPNDLGAAQRNSPLTARSWIVAARALQAFDPAGAVRLLSDHYPDLPQPEGDVALGDAYRAASDVPRAVEAYQRVYCHYLSGESAARASAALTALNAPRGSPAQLLHRADRMADAKDYLGARREYVSLAASLTGLERDQARLRIGAIDYQRNLIAAAWPYLRGLDVESPEAEAERQYWLAECARSRRDDDAMMEAVVRLTSAFPHSSWRLKALLTAANRYLLVNRPADYLPLEKSIYTDFPTAPQAAQAHWKATFQAYLSGSGDAAALLREHLRNWPNHPTQGSALYFLGRHYEETGDRSAARACFARIAAVFENHYYALVARDRLKDPEIASAPPPAATAEISQFLDSLKLSAPPPVPPDATAATAARIERSRILRSAGLDELADSELRWGARHDCQPSLVALEMAAAASEPHQAMHIMKVLYPEYLNQPLPSAPRQFWELLFPLPYKSDLVSSAQDRNLDPYLMAGLIRQESEFDPHAVSRAKAYGLTQVRPATGRQYARQLGMRTFTVRTLYQPSANLKLGTTIFRSMLDQQNGSVERTLAAYNAGPLRAVEWAGWGNFREPAEFIESIPFTETRDYVQAVLRNAEMYRRLYQ